VAAQLPEQALSIRAQVRLPKAAEDVFRVAADIDRWHEWLMRTPSKTTDGTPIAVGTKAIVPLENFWGTPLGVATALASLSRTYPYGRAYGEMEVVEFFPDRRLTLESRNCPVRFRVSVSVTRTPAGCVLEYAENFDGLAWWLAAVALLVLPLALPVIAALQLVRPIFGQALRRRLRQVASIVVPSRDRGS
jgi:hypothetical protein